jgi:hypothetical protein
MKCNAPSYVMEDNVTALFKENIIEELGAIVV